MTKSKGIRVACEAQKWLEQLSADRTRMAKRDIFDIADYYIYEWWWNQHFSEYADEEDRLHIDRDYIVAMNRVEELQKLIDES
jgi:hypothetical protein